MILVVKVMFLTSTRFCFESHAAIHVVERKTAKIIQFVIK